MSTIATLIQNALVEIRVARAGDTVSPEDQTLALYVLNELLDAWNAKPGTALYATQKPTFPLQTNHQPHTIGVTTNSPDFAVSVGRPTKILEANLILSNNIRKPLNIRDDQWWMSLLAPQITAAIATDLWYNAAWPNGNLYLYPIITTAYSIELLIEGLLASVVATDTFTLPMGYQAALRLTLAEACAGAFGQPVTADLATRARRARAAVFGVNAFVPTIRTVDGGMPRGGNSADGVSFIYTGFGTA